MTYLFDFGDHWEFKVQLLDISEEHSEIDQPTILVSHGSSPLQYPDWDHEDEHDEEDEEEY